MNTVNETEKYSINVIGAGGIGSWIIHSIVRPARRFAEANDIHLVIRLYDSDKVDEANVHHQNYRPSDVGKTKVSAVCEELSEFDNGPLSLEPFDWDVRSEGDFERADLTIVAVDSPDARELVIASEKAGKWAICSCAGDSFMFLTEESTDLAISMVTRGGQSRASCQLPGAISAGRIESGNIAVAVVAQTWALRSLREINGDCKARRPVPRAGSTVLGTLGQMTGRKEGLE